jgi:MoxR-like ATPase
MQSKVKLNELLALVDHMQQGVPLDEVRITDSRDGRFYRYDARICLALKVALITGRPLLLIGPPGCGKSSLAPYVARNLNMEQLTYTVTETAEASDLLWRVDYLKRLNDAQVHEMKPLEHYVEKGLLWRAFQPDAQEDKDERSGTVVLIDEIDKASASFANSLLVAIGSMEFDVPLLQSAKVAANENAIILVIITSNEERELPPALLRRCVTFRVNYATAQELVEITKDRWPMWMEDSKFRDSVEALAKSLTSDEIHDSKVSTAEFLDLVQVLKMGNVSPGSDAWRAVEGLVLLRAEESVS